MDAHHDDRCWRGKVRLTTGRNSDVGVYRDGVWLIRDRCILLKYNDGKRMMFDTRLVIEFPRVSPRNEVLSMTFKTLQRLVVVTYFKFDDNRQLKEFYNVIKADCDKGLPSTALSTPPIINNNRPRGILISSSSPIPNVVLNNNSSSRTVESASNCTTETPKRPLCNQLRERNSTNKQYNPSIKRQSLRESLSSVEKKSLSKLNGQQQYGDENCTDNSQSSKRYKVDSLQLFTNSSPKTIESTDHRLGFSNLGNTCYMNAILQSLFAIEPFAKELINAGRSMIATGINNLTSALSELANKRNIDDKQHLLSQIKSAIASDVLRWTGSAQQDAHEFLSQLLDQVKEECNQTKMDDTDSNPITSNFVYTLRHNLCCEGCNNIIEKYELNSDLSLHLDRSTNLERCLIVVVKRYHFDDTMGQSKLATAIDIPLYLTIKHTTDSHQLSYKLGAVVSHIGHYVCDLFDPINHQWMHCDDDTVSMTSIDRVQQSRQRTGYIFIYTTSVDNNCISSSSAVCS